MVRSTELLPRVSLALALHRTGSEEFSVFAGPPASVASIRVAIRKLAACYPDTSDEAFNVIAERISKTGMSERRLEYAVNRVLDTFRFQRLTPADILDIDVKCRILSYAEMCNEVAKSGASTDDYAPIRISGADKPAWILKTDKARYNIPNEL